MLQLKILSFANCNSNFLIPTELKLISAFLFEPIPSNLITSPLPNFECSTMLPTVILLSNKLLPTLLTFFKFFGGVICIVLGLSFD